MEIYKKYTFHNPKALPLEDNESGQFPDDDILKELGFMPEDEELCFSQLSKEWNGHAKGAAVIHGLTVKGYPFAVENTENEAF